jgi:chromosome segregation ATPase
MTPEDIAQITAIVADAEQRLAAKVADVEQRLAAKVADVEGRLTARQERAVEAIGNDFSELRQEFKAQLQPIATRLATVENRLDNFLQTLISMDQRMTALLRQSDRLERDNGTILTTQAVQQTAIDQLAQRLTKLEREIHPEQ